MTVDADLLNRLETELAGRDRDHAITSAELADKLDVVDGEASPKTREAVRILIDERGVPVRSGSCGYWVCQNRTEAEDYLDNLRSRINGIENRMHTFRAAWINHDHDTADTTDEVEA